MKQFFALMLCLAMLLSLTACGNKEDSPTAPNTPSNTLSDATSVNTNASPDPETITSEETFALQKYVSILQILNNYVADGYIKVQAIVDGEEVKYSGQEALNYCYKQLEELTVVDKWVGTEHTSDTSVNWDRLAVMADFVVIEDVRLSETGITEDSVGNRSAVQQLGTWEYDESGRVSMFQEQSNLKGSADNGNHVFSNLIDQNPSGLRLLCDYTYDENGNLVELSYYRDQVYAKVTPSYDADGNMISATYVLANGTEGSAVYTYDQVGQLVSVTCPQLSESSIDGELVYNYTYNSNGNVEKAEYARSFKNATMYTEVYEYTYDGNHIPTGCTYTRTRYHGTSGEPVAVQQDVYTYTCDDQGRITAVEVAAGDDLSVADGTVVSTAVFKTAYIEVTYGNFYIYTPAAQSN